MAYQVTGIDHVQLAMPAGLDAEQRAEAFYRDLLGLARRPKPPQLAKRGGCWFEQGPVRVHLGVPRPFPSEPRRPPLDPRRALSDSRARARFTAR